MWRRRRSSNRQVAGRHDNGALGRRCRMQHVLHEAWSVLRPLTLPSPPRVGERVQGAASPPRMRGSVVMRPHPPRLEESVRGAPSPPHAGERVGMRGALALGIGIKADFTRTAPPHPALSPTRGGEGSKCGLSSTPGGKCSWCALSPACGGEGWDEGGLGVGSRHQSRFHPNRPPLTLPSPPRVGERVQDAPSPPSVGRGFKMRDPPPHAGEGEIIRSNART